MAREEEARLTFPGKVLRRFLVPVAGRRGQLPEPQFPHLSNGNHGPIQEGMKSYIYRVSEGFLTHGKCL